MAYFYTYLGFTPIAIQMTGGSAPSKEAMKLYQKYIDGETELEEIRKILIEKYTVK